MFKKGSICHCFSGSLNVLIQLLDHLIFSLQKSGLILVIGLKKMIITISEKVQIVLDMFQAITSMLE